MAFFVAKLFIFTSGRTPHGPVIANPIKQSALKAYITSSLFRLDPLMAENFVFFG
jgi:hypothetical protein